MSNTEQTYYELAEFLHNIGWRSPCDAQWENLRDSLAKIRLMLSVERSLNDQIEIDTLLHGLRLNQRRIEELEKLADSYRQDVEKWCLECSDLEVQLAAKQAAIDCLMLEYCPNEMTEEQMAEWAGHQKKSALEEKHE